MTALKAREAAKKIRERADDIPTNVAPADEERLVAYVDPGPDGETHTTAYDVQAVSIVDGEVVLSLRARPKVMTTRELRGRIAGFLGRREVEVEIDGKRYAVTDAGVRHNGEDDSAPTVLTAVER